jgi:hypothetical protein
VATIQEVLVCHPVPSLPSAVARRAGAAIAALLVAMALVACQGAVTAPADGWTEAQLAQVFDLSELGRELVVAPSGDHLLLDGRRLPPEVVASFPHLTMGRSSNLLRFADDALEAMEPEARAFVLRAAPGELRARLASYGLGLADLRAAWGERGDLGLAGLLVVASDLDRAGARTANSGTVPNGARLLADLGVTR